LYLTRKLECTHFVLRVRYNQKTGKSFFEEYGEHKETKTKGEQGGYSFIFPILTTLYDTNYQGQFLLYIKEDGIHLEKRSIGILEGEHKKILRTGFPVLDGPHLYNDVDTYVLFGVDQLIELASRTFDRLNVTMIRSRREMIDEDARNQWLNLPEQVTGSILGFI
jgi:hypothetical protein